MTPLQFAFQTNKTKIIKLFLTFKIKGNPIRINDKTVLKNIISSYLT